MVAVLVVQVLLDNVTFGVLLNNKDKGVNTMTTLYITRRWVIDDIDNAPVKVVFQQYYTNQDELLIDAGTIPAWETSYFDVDPVTYDNIVVFPTIAAGLAYMDAIYAPMVLANANSYTGNAYSGYVVISNIDAVTYLAIQNCQPLSALLSSIAGLSPSAGQMPYFTGGYSAGVFNSTTYGRSLLNLSNAAALAAAVAAGVTPATVNNAPGRSLTTSTGAVGFQPNATQNVEASYDLTLTCTATIGGTASAKVVLEICATNSATPSDWVAIGEFTNGQAISLALALQSVQTMAGNISKVIPAGYYAKLREITSGTTTFSLDYQQEKVTT